MRNVGFSVEESAYSSVAAELPTESWVDLMPVADNIEQQLWQKYERDFSSNHEESLAWRYQPTGEAETALVLKYFPNVPFTLKDGSQIEITWQGIVLPKTAELLEWDNVKNINVLRNFGRDTLHVQHVQPNAHGKNAAKSLCRASRKRLIDSKACWPGTGIATRRHGQYRYKLRRWLSTTHNRWLNPVTGVELQSLLLINVLKVRRI
jgi:hypothetical protein